MGHNVKKYWKTRDGRILTIRDMSTDHLENCVQMLLDQYRNAMEMVEVSLAIGEIMGSRPDKKQEADIKKKLDRMTRSMEKLTKPLLAELKRRKTA